MKLYDGLSGEEITSVPPADATLGQLKQSLANGIAKDHAIILLNQEGLTCHPDDLVRDQRIVYLFTRPSTGDPCPPRNTLPSLAPQRELQTAPPIPGNPPGELLRHRNELWRQWKEAVAEFHCAEQCAKFIVQFRDRLARQMDAARCVVANLVHYYAALVHVVSVFQGQYEEKVAQYEDLLAAFPHDLDRLRATPLHPTLNHIGTGLLDLITKEGHPLEPWQEKCRKEWERVRSIMADLSTQLKEIKVSVEVEKDYVVPMAALSINEMAVVDEQQALAEQCEAHFGTATSALSSASSSSSAADLSVFLDLQKKFENSVRPKLEANRRLLMKALMEVQTAHADMFTALAARVRRIVQQQSRINSLQRKLPLYAKLMERLDDHFSILRQCHHLPEAYQWGLLEVVRRRAFARLCLQRMSQYQEALGRLLATEVRERERFQRQYGQYLGQAIIPGLQEPLPCEAVVVQLRAQLQNFSSLLPPLDTPEQVISFFDGMPWERELGDPPDSLLPASLEQLITSLPSGDVPPLSPGGTEPSLDVFPTPSASQAATRLRELEASVVSLEQQLQEERERQVVAVEASSSSYLETLQRIAQHSHFVTADLASPSGLQALETHVLHQQKFKEAVVSLATRCHIMDPAAISTPGKDPSAALTSLMGKVAEMQESHADIRMPHQRYRQALDALLALLGLQKCKPSEPIPFETLEDMLGSIADLREEHSVMKAQLKEVRGMNQKVISLTNFGLGDTAIFIYKTGLPQPPNLEGSGSSAFGAASVNSTCEGPGVFEAVHSGTPHWYLSEETAKGLFRRYPALPAFVIINVVNVEDHVATAEYNPFGLPTGTVFHEVVGEWVYDPVRSDMTESSSATKP